MDSDDEDNGVLSIYLLTITNSAVNLGKSPALYVLTSATFVSSHQQWV